MDDSKSCSYCCYINLGIECAYSALKFLLKCLWVTHIQTNPQITSLGFKYTNCLTWWMNE